MKLLTFLRSDAAGRRIGALNGDDLVTDLTAVRQRVGMADTPNFTDMLGVIQAGPPVLRVLEQLLRESSGREHLKLSALQLLAPIPNPRRNIFCVGRNYVEHFEEGERVRQSGQRMHEYPAFFTKATRSVIGPYDAIPYDPAITKQLDWETELALIIGVGGANIRQADARSHVFGYTVLNDVSARDLQRRHGGQFMKGKSLDGTCPMGPWIVTADEIDPDNLRLLTRVNGVIKQDSNTSKLHFKIERLIEELSLGMTLESGDVLATGTPAGVGWPRNPPEFLQPGDILESELVGIGCLRNQVTPVL